MGWVGRSGAQRIRNGGKELVTNAHVLPSMNKVITRVLGQSDAELLSLKVDPGDVFELISGGTESGRARIAF
jgi:hypothetical protein